MSILLAVAFLAAWLVAASYFTRRWHGVVPPLVKDLPEDERWAATQSFLSLQADRNVNRWRRTIVTLGAVAIILGWGVLEDERRDAQRVEDACETRVIGRADTRSAIVAGVDEIARYAELEPADREQVVDQVEDRVYTELPPPDC